MTIKNLNAGYDFRTLKEGRLIRMTEGGQPVIFKGIREREGVDDEALIIVLDPIEGLSERQYPLNNHGSLKDGFCIEYINPKSEEGREYIKLITQ